MNKWFKHPIAYFAIGVAIICGLAFLGAALPGFGNMPNGTKNMQIVVVDYDQSTGSKTMTKGLKDNLPFKVKRTDSKLASIKSQLTNRSAALAVVLPKNFIKDVKQQKTPHIKFYVNDSNGMLQNSLNRSIISQIETKIKDNLTSQKTTGMIASLIAPNVAKQVQVRAQKQARNITNPAQLAGMRKLMPKQIQLQVQKQASKMAQRLGGGLIAKTVHINKMPSSYKYQMAPMFLNLGTYLGVMIMTIILTMMFMSARFSMGKVKAYFAYQVTGILASIIVPFFTIGLLRALINFSGTTFWALVGTQMLFVFAAFEFSSIFTFLCGSIPSMIILLPLMAMQVVAGGGILPRVVLNNFYQNISKVTPMYQGITNSFNVLYGGSIDPYIQSLGWIAVVGIICSMLFAWIGYRQKHIGVFASIMQVN
ncbi:ABC transporter permease [Lentilactobacillus kosonis]|uniref:Conserved domain protein n=1 Tax=Lentilactobacillus kosonis TaxID=2810561 RepID=A0A401FJ34_9LACO|nr:ABC transporter permease [Lentilactobacillus kosonis]GAY72400.1 conserved domain protein [Lentilactobacillus kosonis]